MTQRFLITIFLGLAIWAGSMTAAFIVERRKAQPVYLRVGETLYIVNELDGTVSSIKMEHDARLRLRKGE